MDKGVKMSNFLYKLPDITLSY